MATFVLFVLVLILWAYAADTKAKLRNLAALLDKAHETIGKEFDSDRERIEKLEIRAKKKIG